MPGDLAAVAGTIDIQVAVAIEIRRPYRQAVDGGSPLVEVRPDGLWRREGALAQARRPDDAIGSRQRRQDVGIPIAVQIVLPPEPARRRRHH